MTGNNKKQAFLRLTNGGNAKQPAYILSESFETLIGREPSCQIVLDSKVYGGVSRRHAAIRPIANKQLNWEICDLNSANGTYINNQRLQGSRILQTGDKIGLGINGPAFIFEITTKPSSQITNPGQNDLTLTQLFPIISTGRDLRKKAYLIPASITVAFVVFLFAAIGRPLLFNLLIAAYIAGLAYFFVYQLCGKRKPWWWLLTACFLCILILISPLLPLFVTIFREILPGKLPLPGENLTFPALLIRMFFGAGLMEELLKALPVFFAYLLGRFAPASWRENLGVWEPLDGILLGTASAVGFTLLETLGQYVPEIIHNVTLQGGKEIAQLLGLQLLIARILGSVAGHIAYSGYLGYFIGLSALKPKKGWIILTVGYLSAAGLHALWNAAGTVNVLMLAFVGVVSYAFLAAAILKARALSPTRAQNFATRLS
ncbi:PrsW family glutamic-type intramembrane protease [Ancylothrix sp. C2]|uniref:PrsW family glutamic-type intramembrane protease n=1 Tax=Ancylothrix sp. D3o TaxID=2953691 RepID=UPI0021BB8BBF|nr:PrsW family glutamic-type intramembrane protease [Ancylothrix sp. D3o]MCT7951718.1 PrsW family glutamic-type intramembrane protease [Ancylothrix sp. D3o]